MASTPTFSLAITGIPAESNRGVATVDVPDSTQGGTNAASGATAYTVANAGGEAQAMRLGLPFLAQGPDGGLYWAVLDPYRSLPGGSLYVMRI